MSSFGHLINLSLGNVRQDPEGAAFLPKKKFKETFLHCLREQMEGVWIRKPTYNYCYYYHNHLECLVQRQICLDAIKFLFFKNRLLDENFSP